MSGRYTVVVYIKLLGLGLGLGLEKKELVLTYFIYKLNTRTWIKKWKGLLKVILSRLGIAYLGTSYDHMFYDS